MEHNSIEHEPVAVLLFSGGFTTLNTSPTVFGKCHSMELYFKGFPSRLLELSVAGLQSRLLFGFFIKQNTEAKASLRFHFGCIAGTHIHTLL